MLYRAIRELLPNTNWRMSNPIPTNAAEFNAVFEIQSGISDTNDLEFSNDASTFGITWEQVQTKVSALESGLPLEQVREYRNILLAQTDWWANSDLTMTAEQTTYRQLLRDITETCSSLDDVVWPIKPEVTP
jgi:hypothetical protein